MSSFWFYNSIRNVQKSIQRLHEVVLNCKITAASNA
jgi:hypothetical protein